MKMDMDNWDSMDDVKLRGMYSSEKNKNLLNKNS